LCVGSLNLTEIVLAQNTGIGTRISACRTSLPRLALARLFPMFVVFFISALAETNRPPFDLPEAESELVAGFMVEYGSTPYMMFMLGEYVAIALMCALTTILFLGGWLPPVDVPPFTWVPGIIWFVLKAALVFFMFSMVKAFVPRYRYDQLMRLGWKVFLPMSLLPWWCAQADGDARDAFLQFTGTRPEQTRRLSMQLAQAAKSLLLKEFVGAFFLSMRYFFKPKRRELSLMRRAMSARAFAASMRCAAIPTAKSAALPASCARRSARRRRSPSRPARAAMTARGAPRATTSTWSNASIAASVRKPARWTPSSRGRISSSPRRRARNSITTRKNCWRTATVGNVKSRAISRSIRPTARGERRWRMRRRRSSICTGGETAHAAP
jgi:hypothetical protein